MNTFTSPCIDPRTGLIRFQLPLLHLIGNDHMGPALSLMLDYLPLETQPSLYGQGFRDTLSWFNPQTRQLQTDGGARFGLTRRDGEWAFLSPCPQHIKLATRRDSLWIYYRNGAIEIVSRSPQQPADDVLWRLQTRLSAGGNALTLSWGWRQHLALLISVADDDGELLRTSLRLLPPAGENARVRMDVESGSPAQAELIADIEATARSAAKAEADAPAQAGLIADIEATARSAAKTEADAPAQAGLIADIEANARSARNPASEAFVQANASARAGAKADAKSDTASAINAELIFTCFPASQAPVTTLLTVAGGRLIQLSRGPTGERILCRIAYHPTLGVIQQVNLSGGVCELFGYAEDAVFPLVNGHTTTVSDGDKRLYCLTETFSISHSDAVAPHPTRHHHPDGAAEAPTPYQSVITRILPMPAENVLHSDDGAPEIQTIIHRYNRLHLLVAKEEIRETQVCGQRRRGRTSTQWAYHCDDALALADQSAHYALAREKRVTWDENGPAPRNLPRYRCEISRYEYDNGGNLIQRVYPDGSSERITYYSPAGEEHCPAEPQGFIRFIKSVTHCRGGGDPATGRTVFYRYRGFPGRSGSPLAGRQMILCIAAEAPGRLLQRFDYHMQPDGGNNEHGRLIKKTYTHYPENTPNTFSETYRWSKMIPAGQNDADAQLQRETQLRHLDDAAPLTTTRVWRHAGYALLSFTDAYGNTTRYHYAPEGYLEKTEHHADTPYVSVSHRWLEENFRQNGLITLTRTDIQGNRIISHIDGFGRLHRRYYQCRQHPLNRLPIEQREYDPLGRLSRLTTYDHSDEEGPIRPLVTRYNDCAWDHWGHRYASVDHDGQQGVCHYHHLDIIKQKSSKQTRSDYRSGRHGNAAPHYSGILYERYRHGKPLRQLRLLPQPDGKASVIISELRLNYDDQCRLSAVNERGTGQAIRWRYNDDDRVAQQTLQDGSLLHYRYRSPDDSPSFIAISAGPTAPQQTLYRCETDRWGRMTASREGEAPTATHVYYAALSPLPTAVQHADGTITRFDFHPKHNALIRQSWEGGHRELHYDNTTGYLIGCTEYRTDASPSGAVVSRVALRYNSRGQRVQEMIFSARDQLLYEVYYRYSLAGRLLSLRDSEDTHIRYRYDAAGRLSSVRDNYMEVHFYYDHLERMTRRQVRLPGQENVTTRWLFDAFSRPVNILVTSQTGAETPVELIISQQFNGLDQIVKRTLQERRGGKTLRRYESFDYSARGCLTACRYAGELPLLAAVGEQFEQVIAETFTWDALNNLTEATVNFAQPTQTGCPAEQTTSYGYHHSDCPTRRTSIQYGGADARTVQLVYDPQGRLIDDGHRRRYRYDPLGRLQAVSGDGLPATFYCYDAFNRLQGQSGEDATSLHFYHGRRLAHIKHHCPTRPSQEIDRVSYVHAAGLAAVKTRSALGTDILLTATDSRGSLLRYGRQPTQHYLAWGTPAAATSSLDAACASPLTRYLPLWQGELYDTASGGYLLGSGYRLYRPDLQGFTTQDNLRVGGLTGINRYLYGRGDPINRFDPDGRLSWNAWVNYAYGAGATLMAPAVFLAAGPAGLATALTLSATQLTSGILAIAAGMLDRQHPHVAGVLSLCSLGVALAASGIGEAIAARETMAIESAGFAPRPIYHLNKSEMGLYTNYANRHILAFQTHGSPTGALLQNPEGQMVSAATVAYEYIQPLLDVAMKTEQQVFSPNEPLLLLACYGARSGAAHEVANALGRPVAAYDNLLFTVKSVFAEGFAGGDIMPRYRAAHNPLRRLWLHVSGQPMFHSASYHMVYPDGFDAMAQEAMTSISNFERHYYGIG